MPTIEYLQAILQVVKDQLPYSVWNQLHRAALPVSGGHAAWRSAELSNLEALALRELRPTMLRSATDDELKSLWAKVAQWHGRARRKKQDLAPFERAASHVLQALGDRGIEVPGPFAESIRSRSTLAKRLEELPAVVMVETDVVGIAPGIPPLGVFKRIEEPVIDSFDLFNIMNSVGVNVTLDRDAGPDVESTALYDLALVRSGCIQQTSGEFQPPVWMAKSDAHNGAMLAVMVPQPIRVELQKAGLLQSDAPEKLHVTLLFLGEASTLSQSAIAAIETVVTMVCAEHRTLRMELSGVGGFPKHDRSTIYAVASAVGLSQLQADLERAVGQIILLPDEHGWTPHLTLGTSPMVPNPELIDDIPGWPAESIAIVVGDGVVADVPLQGEIPGALSPWDNAEHMADAAPSAIKVACSSPAKQIIYYLVSEPGVSDAHGHSMSPEQIEDALHGYMANSRELKLEHQKPITGRAVIVEGFIAPMTLTQFHGVLPPDGPIKEGSSIVGVHYEDTDLWNMLSAEEHGISWGGYASRMER